MAFPSLCTVQHPQSGAEQTEMADRQAGIWSMLLCFLLTFAAIKIFPALDTRESYRIRLDLCWRTDRVHLRPHNLIPVILSRRDYERWMAPADPAHLRVDLPKRSSRYALILLGMAIAGAKLFTMSALRGCSQLSRQRTRAQTPSDAPRPKRMCGLGRRKSTA